MKLLAAMTTVILAGSISLACTPPPPGTPAYYIQKAFLTDVFDSQVVTKAIIDQGNQVYIVSVKPGEEYQLKLSNKCSMKIVRDTEGQPIGTCRELLPLKVADIKCGKK